MSTTEFSNWGRWGKADELGALNLVTPDIVLKAAGLVKKGKAYSLSTEIREGRRMPRLSFRPENQHYVRVWGAPTRDVGSVAEDTLILGCHGTSTHMDALCHVWTADKMYNGFSGEYVQGHGALRLGIENAQGIVTRGVLLDIAAMKGVEYLPEGYGIAPKDLEACCQREGVQVRAGDAVLVRTGWPKTYTESPEKYNSTQPGLDFESAVWLCRRDVCLVGSDNSAVAGGSDGSGARGYSGARERNTHNFFLQDAGTYLIEMMDLEPISRDKVYEFLFIVAPLKVTGGTGSSVNPIAVA